MTCSSNLSEIQFLSGAINMPHVILEYSNNITQPIDFKKLFTDIHQSLHTIVGIHTENIKSRVYIPDHYFIGDQNERNAFVALNIALFLEGHESVLQTLGKTILKQLNSAFSESKKHMDLQITAQLQDLIKTQYFKMT